VGGGGESSRAAKNSTPTLAPRRAIGRTKAVPRRPGAEGAWREGRGVGAGGGCERAGRQRGIAGAASGGLPDKVPAPHALGRIRL
jgi:hypothetical protein